MKDMTSADFETGYRAVEARDGRFDGRVFTAVLTTGIYCRPSCPSRTPLARNVRFYANAAAAVAAGFRACKRCRPDALPGSRDWDHRGDLVARALRLIAAGEIDERGVSGLAARLSVSERHLHRSLVAEVGVGPLALARTRRAQTARLLIDQTSLSMTDVAFAAGFASVRQYNDVMREEFGCPPSQLRRGDPASQQDGPQAPGGGLVLRLTHRQPYAAADLFGFLSTRAVGGVEDVSDPTAYRRVLRTGHGLAVASLAAGAGHVTARLRLPDLSDLGSVVARLRRLLDLDADPLAVDAVLAADPALAELVGRRPGLRVPGAVDGFELAVRAILGQQVSVAGARTLAGRIVAKYGERLEQPDGALAQGFPTAEVMAEADLAGLGLTGGRVAALRVLAAEVAAGRLVLDAGADREQARAQLVALPGVGPWTAEYVAMRALADPDAWPGTDLVLRRQVAARSAQPDQWRPWRAYGALHLWAAAGDNVTASAQDVQMEESA
jgi:AraC family transcriptional regulator, regulatory protein of adaptative response / DNA-3-methyladenine glycosylase II